MCKGCLCMACAIWESCPFYARCEQAEISSCSQRKECDFYRPVKKKEQETKK